jgi:ribonuclease BN (tRNA processing enzyme)
MKVTALGVGDAFSAKWYSTCLLVEADGVRLLIDCPHPIRKVLHESAGLDLPDVDAVVLTHLHADHCSGLEGLGFFRHFVAGSPLPLLSHPGVTKRLWERLAPGMDTLFVDLDSPPESRALADYFELQALSTSSAATFGPFTIEARWTKHHVPTTALRIRAGGASIGYSADTAFDVGLIDWLADCDLVIHETNLGTHTPLGDLLGLADEVKAKMRLVHYPDFFDVEGCAIRCLAQGEVVEV